MRTCVVFLCYLVIGKKYFISNVELYPTMKWLHMQNVIIICAHDFYTSAMQYHGSNILCMILHFIWMLLSNSSLYHIKCHVRAII